MCLILKDFSGRPRTCAFYNFTLNNMAGGWSSAGCVYDGQVNGRDVCLCDHLTNFAVLIVSTWYCLYSMLAFEIFILHIISLFRLSLMNRYL